MTKSMRTIYLVLARICFPAAVFAQTQEFGAWKVDIKIDAFEGEVKPTLSTEIFSPDGEKIGALTIGYFVAPRGNFSVALLSPSVPGLDPTFPDCDYEFMRYKLDDGESEYFPTAGYACPALEVRDEMAQKMSSASTLRFTARGVVGVVSLEGFREAWNFSISSLRK